MKTQFFKSLPQRARRKIKTVFPFFTSRTSPEEESSSLETASDFRPTGSAFDSLALAKQLRKAMEEKEKGIKVTCGKAAKIADETAETAKSKGFGAAICFLAAKTGAKGFKRVSKGSKQVKKC